MIPNNEDLIASGEVRFIKEKSETLFHVGDLQKQFPKYEVKETDIFKREISEEKTVRGDDGEETVTEQVEADFCRLADFKKKKK